MKRADWLECQPYVDPERLVFIDETCLKTDFTRLRGWTLGGARLVESVPAGHWKTCTLVHAIGMDGTRAAMVLEGAINQLSFEGFCESFLSPTLRSGDIVVLDNLNSHKSETVRKTIEAADASLVFLPPYSPDLNPIEMIFSKLKQLIRAARPRSFDKIIDAAGSALQKISPDDIQACYEHCGYMVA